MRKAYLQRPYLDMSMDQCGSSKVNLGLIPLTKHGMFLEVRPPGQLAAKLVFIQFGTIFYLDKSVVHAGGFTPDGDESLRIQSVFSETLLGIEHFQIKSGEDYIHNEHQTCKYIRFMQCSLLNPVVRSQCNILEYSPQI